MRRLIKCLFGCFSPDEALFSCLVGSKVLNRAVKLCVALAAPLVLDAPTFPANFRLSTKEMNFVCPAILKR